MGNPTKPNGIIMRRDFQANQGLAVFIRTETGYDEPFLVDYIKNDPDWTLDPFVHWLDWIPGVEFVHPIIAKVAKDGGWMLSAFDAYHEVRYNSKAVTLDWLYNEGKLYEFFDSVLDSYQGKQKI
jgi:hypothetical protein